MPLLSDMTTQLDLKWVPMDLSGRSQIALVSWSTWRQPGLFLLLGLSRNSGGPPSVTYGWQTLSQLNCSCLITFGFLIRGWHKCPWSLPSLDIMFHLIGMSLNNLRGIKEGSPCSHSWRVAELWSVFHSALPIIPCFTQIIPFWTLPGYASSQGVESPQS